AAGLSRGVLDRDAVAEEQVPAVVVSTRWTPAHPPGAPVGPLGLGLDGLRVRMPAVPQRRIYGPHRPRTTRSASTCLMRREQHLCPHQCRNSGVLDDVVVVADEHPDTRTLRKVEDGVLIAR